MESSLSDSNETGDFHSEETLWKWIQEAKNGNDVSFAQLVEIFAPRLQGLIYRMLLDWEETRDVVQETFIRAHRALGGYKPRGKFRSWLFQIGTRLAIDALRKRKRRLPEFIQRGDENPPEARVEDTALQRSETMRAIEKAVGELSPEQRTAFVLSEYEGYGNREIADVMGCSVKSVEMSLYRARLALREKLKAWV